MSDADKARTALAPPETGERAVFTRLWTRLQAYDLDKQGDAIPFTAKLAAECGWSRDKARRVAVEYKRFVALALCSGHGACPSRAVDEAWHLHLIDTRRYWGEFCRDVLECEFHHEPGRGGLEEELRFGRLYRQTLADYRRFFGEEPPAEIWPMPEQGPPVPHPRPTSGQGLLPRLHGVLRRGIRPFAAIAVLLAVPGCAVIYNSSSPGALQGPAFLVLYVVLLALACLICVILQNRIRPGRGRTGATDPLGPYHLAFLAGGTQRVFETAMTRLYSRGEIAFQSDTPVLVREPGPQALPMERLIAERIGLGGTPTGVTIEPALAPIRQELTAAGLLHGPDQIRMKRQIPVLVLGLLLLLGLVRLAFGLANGRPVMGLLIVFALTVIAGAALWDRKLRPLPAAKEVERKARKALEAKGRPSAASPDLVSWVALSGSPMLFTVGLADFSHFLDRQALLATPASSGGGSSCGSGGSSCGGSCGGGGCGG